MVEAVLKSSLHSMDWIALEVADVVRERDEDKRNAKIANRGERQRKKAEQEMLVERRIAWS